MSELKPCPFCGGEPYMQNVEMAGCAYVVCTDCRVQSDDGSVDRVTANWNTRAEPAEQADYEARMRSAIASASRMTYGRQNSWV